jgi:hypothetical protein
VADVATVELLYMGCALVSRDFERTLKTKGYHSQARFLRDGTMQVQQA